MSHFVDTMAYVGEIPWHKLGTYLGNENVGADVMRKAAGLDFHVSKLPAFVKLPDGSFAPIADRYGMMASHKTSAYPVVVSDRYNPFQTQEMFEFCERLRGAAGGELKFHTAGALKGGAIVWVLAQMAGSIDVRRRDGRTDTSAPFLMISNSFNGSSAIEIAATSVRVVCWNTLSAALNGTRGTKSHFSVRHTASASEQLAHAAKSLGYAATYFDAYGKLAQDLANTPMNRERFTSFAAQLLTGLDDEREALEKVAESDGRSAARLDTQFDALVGAFERGKGNAGADRFDALNAVTEYVDHQRGRMTQYANKAKALGALGKSLESAAFGSGAEMKARAVKLLSR